MAADLPLGYFVSFRSYGTWLHGDPRGSVDRLHNQYGSPFLPTDKHRVRLDEKLFKQAPVSFDLNQRAAIDQAIRESCHIRQWILRALNVRSSHVHVVVCSSSERPELILNAFKANATRQLREDALWSHAHSPWSGGGSKRYLWDLLSIERAIDYVMNWQDGLP